MRYIDVTPTWEGVLPALLAVFGDAETAEARRTAGEELRRMARLADSYVAEHREPVTSEHEVDHSLCDKGAHLARRASGEDCPMVACLVCEARA